MNNSAFPTLAAAAAPQVLGNGLPVTSKDNTSVSHPATPQSQRKLPSTPQSQRKLPSRSGRNNKKAKGDKNNATNNNTLPHQHPLPPSSPEPSDEVMEFDTPGDQPTKEQYEIRRRFKGIVPLPAMAAAATATSTSEIISSSTSVDIVSNNNAPSLNLTLAASALNYENGFLIQGASAVQATSSPQEGAAASLTIMAPVPALTAENGL